MTYHISDEGIKRAKIRILLLLACGAVLGSAASAFSHYTRTGTTDIKALAASSLSFFCGAIIIILAVGIFLLRYINQNFTGVEYVVYGDGFEFRQDGARRLYIPKNEIKAVDKRKNGQLIIVYGGGKKFYVNRFIEKRDQFERELLGFLA